MAVSTTMILGERWLALERISMSNSLKLCSLRLVFYLYSSIQMLVRTTQYFCIENSNNFFIEQFLSKCTCNLCWVFHQSRSDGESDCFDFGMKIVDEFIPGLTDFLLDTRSSLENEHYTSLSSV